MIFRRQFLIGAAAAGLIPTLARAQAAVPAAAARTAFDFTDGKVRAPARIKGVEVSAVLDSGGQYHAIDTRLARDFGIKASGKIDLTGIGGKASAKFSDPIDITVAGVTLEQAQFAVMDLTKLSEGVGRPVELILGAPLFHRYLADLNFAARSLVLEDSAAYPTPDEGAMLPLAAERSLKTVEIIWPKGSVQAVVDTGSDATLVLSPAAAERLGVLKEGPVSTARISGFAGADIAQVTSAPAILMAGNDFADVPITVAPKDFGREATLGCGLLSHFNVGLDFPGGWLILSGRREIPFHRDLTGLQAAIIGTELKITHVARGGPGEKAGFKVGERIVTLNGEAAASANARLIDAPAGQTVAFAVKGGRTRNLTLARYY